MTIPREFSSRAAGLLPLAIGGNQPGYEIEYPMAIVILGGLMSSTQLNLLVVPLVYARFGHVAKEEDEEPGTAPRPKNLFDTHPRFALP